MPILNRYSDESEKSGYFIRANVGGGHPITLQVSDLAERLLVMLGYRSSQSIPSKLVWIMYDVGLLYTLNSLTSISGIGDTEDADRLLDRLDIDSSLSAEREEEIVTELDEYSGPDAETVEELIEHLDKGRASGGSIPERDVGDLGLVQKWVQNQEQLEENLEEIDGYEAFAEASVQTFARHPHLSAPPIWVRGDGGIRYRLSHENYEQTVYIVDYRFKDDYAFQVILEHSESKREMGEVSSSGALLEYENEAGRRGSRIRVSDMLDWVVPEKSIRESAPRSSDMAFISGITEYEGRALEVIREPSEVEDEDLVFGTVDRISNAENPVIEKGGDNFVIDQGEKGETYLVEMVSGNRGRILSRVVEDDPDEQ